MSKPVALNIGGKLYSTSLTTLTRYPESMLGSMFSGSMPTSSDSQGNYFIDRDGKMFRYILNFLRTSHLDLPVGFQEMDLLKREVDFYQIQPLQELLQNTDPNISRIKNVMLNIVHDIKERSYEIEVHTIRVFCTSTALLRILSTKFYCKHKEQLLPVCENPKDLRFLSMEWTELNIGIYSSLYILNCKTLHVKHSNEEIHSLTMFVDNVINIAISEGGFFIHSTTPTSSSPVVLHLTQ